MLEKYYGKIDHFVSKRILMLIDIDIESLGDPYDPNVRYGGRGDSRTFNWLEILVPEFGFNEIFYIHDKLYVLWKSGKGSYTKEFADNMMYELLKYEKFIFAYFAYLIVKYFGVKK